MAEIEKESKIENETPKIRVFQNLERLTGYRALALPHLNEIHVDAKYYGTSFGERVIQHERKHFVYVKRMLNSKHPFLVSLQNNIWDFYDANRIELLRLTEWLKRKLKL